MNTYLDCPAKWSYIYRHRKSTSDTAPLRKGSYIHHLLDLSYTWVKQQPDSRIPERGFDNDTLEALYIPSPQEDDLQIKVESGILVMRYWQYVGNFDYNWIILAPEESYYAPQTTPKGRPYIIEMHVDLLLQHKLTGEFIVVDHKSGKIWSQPEAEADPQMALYIAVLQKAGYPVNQGIYNFLNTTVLKSGNQKWEKNFARRAVVKTNEEGVHTLRHFGARVDEIIDRQEDSGVQFPMVRTKGCAWCGFNEVCTARIQGKIGAARDLLAHIPTRPDSGNRRNAEKEEFLELVAKRQANQHSPYSYQPIDETTVTIKL